MAMNNLDLTAATKLVSDFHNTLTAHNTSAKQATGAYEMASRKALYKTLGEAYGSSLQLVADPELLGQVCAHFGVKPPAEGENPHSAVGRMFWRKKQGDEYVPDKSAWKYGKGFRAAQALKWTAKDYAAKLETYEFEVTGKDGKVKKLKGHIALEACDTALHGNPEADFTAQEHIAAQRWLASTQTPKAEFVADLGVSPEHGQMVGLVAQWDAERSSWVVRDVHASEHDRAWALIAKGVLTRFKEWREVKALTAQDALLDKEIPDDLPSLLALLDEQNRSVRARETAKVITEKLALAAEPKSVDQAA
ncbi:hypothetical protein [Erythrobacter sp. R86502]|uniref:hypothetical protein n=1 Tax=Erythrobacter sp. R86502 TaxID=3093846 RepID=UPI0036D43635